MADPIINLALYAQTDVGMVRSGNEDNFLILDLSTGNSWTANEEEPHELLTFQQGYYGSLLAVSDGMGGALAGEVASRMAVETVRDRMLQLQAHAVYSKLSFPERLRVAIEEANHSINSESQIDPSRKGMGATFTAVGVQSNKVYFGQVGDSRAYLMRQGKIARITKDQSLVQQLIDAGQITEEEAETHSYRNVILQALGAHNIVNVEVNALTLCQLDTLVLCSDGLSGKMHADEIAQIVNSASDFKTACQQLIALANQRGGEDNITVVIVQFSGAGLAQPLGEPIEPQGIARSPDSPTELNWSTGAKTDPLPNPRGSTSRLTGETAVTSSTEPLIPAPPPTTHPLQTRPRTEPLTGKNDRSERLEPITSVWNIEDLESELRARANSKPLEPPAEAAYAHSGYEWDEQNAPPAFTAPPDVKRSRTGLFILVGLVLLALAGGALGAVWYYNQQVLKRSAEEEARLATQRNNDEQKQVQVSRVRERIADLNKKLQTTDKISKEKREDLQSDLDKVTRKLDEVGSLPAEQISEIERRCEALAKDLKEIEEKLDNHQGLLPHSHTNLEPVKC